MPHVAAGPTGRLDASFDMLHADFRATLTTPSAPVLVGSAGVEHPGEPRAR